MYKSFFAFIFCQALTGCGTIIFANITTSVDPSFAPSPHLSLVVAPKNLDAVYYLPFLKEALEMRGFKKVAVSRTSSITAGVYDVKVLLDVGRQDFTKTETVQDYGVVGQDVEWSPHKCKTTNNGLTGKRTRCSGGETKVKNIYGATGSREGTTATISRSINLTFIRMHDNQSVIAAVGKSDESDYECSNAGIYKFLVIHTVNYLNFQTPRNLDYSVTIPEGFSCETAVEYERSIRRSEQQEQTRNRQEQLRPELREVIKHGNSVCAPFKICS